MSFESRRESQRTSPKKNEVNENPLSALLSFDETESELRETIQTSGPKMNKTGNNRFNLQSKIAVNSANKYLGNFLVVPKVIGITNTPKAATSR